MTQTYKTTAQAVLQSVYDPTTQTLRFLQVGTDTAITPSTGMSKDAIFAACYDPSTQSLRYVEVGV